MNTEYTLDKYKLLSELKEIHINLVDIYKGIFVYKYKTNLNFKVFIDKEYKDNGISDIEHQAWNDNFCHRASYTLLNKILFIRICEDKGFMLNADDYIAGVPKDQHIGEKLSRTGLQKWANIVTNYTLGDLVKFAFLDMKKSYKNIVLYKEDKYEILNPNEDELRLKYLSGDINTKKLVLEYEYILNSIVDKLDTNNFNFKHADGNILGDVYEKFMDRDTRKAVGQFYTPEYVIEYILSNTISKADVLENPFVSVADISCGSGHFLIMAYDILKVKFINNLELLSKKYSDEVYTIKKDDKFEELTGREYWKEENIHYHILKHCIYGADIDSFAVQLTTINLLLKDLDNFTDELNIFECDSLIKWEEINDWQYLKKQIEERFETIEYTQTNLFGEENNFKKIKERKLYNLKYKDTLGVERIEKVSKEKAEEIIDLCEFWSKKFDYVVGNPPYVRQERIFNKDYLSKEYEVYNSIADLLTYFIERGIKSVKYLGSLGLIVSDKFTRTNYGEVMRNFISKNYNITHYKDKFDSEKIVFDSATVDSAIIIIKNEEKNNDNIFLYNETTYKQKDLKSAGWYFADQLGINIKEKMDKLGVKIKNISDIRINRGILTGYNNAFIIDSETKNDLCKKDPKNKEIFKKVLRGRDVDQYSVNWNKTYLIFTRRGINIEEYPVIKEYLFKYYEDLVPKKNKADKKGRKPGPYKWYEIQDNVAYFKDFEKEKIIYPNMSIENRFYYDTSGFFSNDKTFIMTSSKYDLKYLSGLLNSNLLFFYFRLTTSKLQGETREYRKIFVNEVPLILETKYEAKITELLNTLLTKNEKYKGLSINEYYQHINEEVKLKINKNKAAINIDQIVYEMYEMTPDEIFYVENDVNRSLTFEKKKYLDDLLKGECQVIFDYMSYYEKYFIDELEKILPVNEFILEHIENVRGIDDIAEKYGFEYTTVALLRDRYAERYQEDQPWLFYDLSDFYKTLDDFIVNYIVDILKKDERYLSLELIRDNFKDKYSNYDDLMKIMRKDNSTNSSIDVMKKVLNNNCITWNRYMDEKTQNITCGKIVKYGISKNAYGLTEWSDEIHKQYFLDAVEEFTSKKPNEKKAKEVLELFKNMDIEDKADYIEIIEGKIKRTFY